MMKTIEQED